MEIKPSKYGEKITLKKLILIFMSSNLLFSNVAALMGGYYGCQ